MVRATQNRRGRTPGKDDLLDIGPLEVAAEDELVTSGIRENRHVRIGKISNIVSCRLHNESILRIDELYRAAGRASMSRSTQHEADGVLSLLHVGWNNPLLLPRLAGPPDGTECRGGREKLRMSLTSRRSSRGMSDLERPRSRPELPLELDLRARSVLIASSRRRNYRSSEF
jgi:hypothetical protein